MSLNDKQSVLMCLPELQRQSKAQRDLEEAVVMAERELGPLQKASTSRSSIVPSPRRTKPAHAKALRGHAHPIAEALWVHQYCGAGNDGRSCGSTNDGVQPPHPPANANESNHDTSLLRNRAQAILNEWRLTLKEGDTVHCPDYMDEYEFDDESRGFVKLYAATIQEVALDGASVSLGDSSSPSKVKYQLEGGERAIFVDFIDYPDESRWILLQPDDPLTLNVVPLGSHERAKRALQDAYPHYQSVKTAQVSTALFSSTGQHDITPPRAVQHVSSSLSQISAPSEHRPTSALVGLLNGGKSKKRAVNGKKQSAKKSNRRSKNAVNGGAAKNHATTNVDVDPTGSEPTTKPASKAKHVIDRKRKRISSRSTLEVQDARAGPGITKHDAELKPPSPEDTGNQTEAAAISKSESSAFTSQRNGHNVDSKPADVEMATKIKRGEELSVEPMEAAKKKKKFARPNVLDFTWICMQCNEAECAADPEAALVLCEGGCHRAFHYPCVNLSAAPSSDENWVCDDCLKGHHRCSLCEEYGADGKEVFCCDHKDCGLFFHESCLSMQNVEMRVADSRIGPTAEDENPDEEPVVASKPSFVCPAHICWTCTEDYVPPDDGGDDETISVKKKKGKGGKKKGRSTNCFAQKRDVNLFRCLHCPVSYHLTCIPPTARFHELALLCHNHSGNRKMPDLDAEYSMQAEVEAKIDKMYDKVTRREVAEKKANDGVANQFFPNVRGDEFVADEDRLLLHLQGEASDHQYLVEGLSFCLPFDIKNEVHSKPPSYQHVYANQYDRSNRPKRKPPSDGKCQCKAKGLSSCDESCLNRMMMIECVGDANKANGEKNPYWNCDLGPCCTNRSLGLRQFAKCKPMREQGKGWGLVAVSGIKARELVQEYVGEIIDEKEKEARLQAWTRDHPNDPNFYVMALDSGWYIDARLKANLSRFINHSCSPNCKLIPFNVNGHMRVGIFSLCDIAPGEFLSYDYQFETKNGEKFRCRCGAANCRGTMKGGKAEEGAVERKTRKEEWQDAKASYDRDLKYLEDVARDQVERASQVDYLVPGAENATEAVAVGPNEKKYRETALSNRLFLWRNVVQGDVSDRPCFLRRKGRKSSPTKMLPTVDVLSAISKAQSYK